MLQSFIIVTCDQCRDTERSTDGEKVGEFMRRLRAAGWVAWLSAETHYCSQECQAYESRSGE